MTIATDIQRTSYAGDGSTVAFATTFPFFDSVDLKVYVVTTASGAETLKTLTTDYTVSGGAGVTGTVTMLTAPASTETLVLVLDPVRKQSTDLANGDGFDVEPIEKRLDRMTLMIQRLDDRLDRAVRLKDGDPAASLTAITTASLRAGKTLMFENTAAADLTVGAPTSSTVVAASETAAGIAELATQTETNTGTDDARIVTPLKLATFVGANIDNGINDFRLTLTTGLPVTTADVTGAGTLYLAPYCGNRIALYNSGVWTVRTSAQVSLALTLTSGKPYDIFAEWNGSAVVLSSLVWTDDTNRATALTTQDGVLVKSGNTAQRYVGTIYASGANTTEDSFAKRYVWNYYNRVARPMRVTEATDTWTYTTAAFRQANGAAANQLDFVVGVAEELVSAEVRAAFSNTNANVISQAGIATEAATTTLAAGCLNQGNVGQVANQIVAAAAAYSYYPAAGRRRLIWLEYSTATGTTTWYGDAGSPTIIQSGIFGRING